jgi:hypothetical protein
VVQPPAAPAAPGGTPQPSLLLPALQELTVGDSTRRVGPELDLSCDLLTALQLAQQQAPDLEALDVARATPSYSSATPEVLQQLAQLGRRLRCMRLPKVAQPWMDDAQQVDAALLELLSQHSQLQQLGVQLLHVPPQQAAPLSGLTQLKEPSAFLADRLHHCCCTCPAASPRSMPSACSSWQWGRAGQHAGAEATA